MPDPSAPDFITDLRRAANAPVSPSFIENVLHRSQRRRRLRLISAFAAPALSAVVLVPLAVNLTQHHRPSQDHLGTAASGPQSVADAKAGEVTSPESRSTTTFDGSGSPRPTLTATYQGNAAPNPLGPTCEPGQLQGSVAQGVAPQPGEASLFINLVNVSEVPCTVGAYPEARFFAAGPLIPFQVRHTGDFLTGDNAEPAQQRQVKPGATVHIFIAKYRCDHGGSDVPDQVADSVNVQLLGGADLATFPLTAGMPGMTSCRSQGATLAGANPGNVLQVSAFLPGPGQGN